jgi:hypothetical protein
VTLQVSVRGDGRHESQMPMTLRPLDAFDQCRPRTAAGRHDTPAPVRHELRHCRLVQVHKHQCLPRRHSLSAEPLGPLQEQRHLPRGARFLLPNECQFCDPNAAKKYDANGTLANSPYVPYKESRTCRLSCTIPFFLTVLFFFAPPKYTSLLPARPVAAPTPQGHPPALPSAAT